MLVAQTKWIVSNRVSRNIAFVTTEGDISNDGGKITAQWERATNALYRLENPARTGLPDTFQSGIRTRNTRRFKRAIDPNPDGLRRPRLNAHTDLRRNRVGQ